MSFADSAFLKILLVLCVLTGLIGFAAQFGDYYTYWTVLGFPMPPFGGPPAVHHSGGMSELIS